MRILKNRTRRCSVESWPITIYYDDREKVGRYRFNSEKFTFEKKHMETGDYTIDGFEEFFCIERKSGLQEFIQNISGKKKWKFHIFLKRLSLVPVKCIIVGESLCNVVRRLKQMNYGQLQPKDVYYWVGQIMFKYKIPILFYGGKGKEREDFLYYIFDSALQALKEMK